MGKLRASEKKQEWRGQRAKRSKVVAWNPRFKKNMSDKTKCYKGKMSRGMSSPGDFGQRSFQGSEESILIRGD